MTWNIIFTIYALIASTRCKLRGTEWSCPAPAMTDENANAKPGDTILVKLRKPMARLLTENTDYKHLQCRPAGGCYREGWYFIKVPHVKVGWLARLYGSGNFRWTDKRPNHLHWWCDQATVTMTLASLAVEAFVFYSFA